MPSLNLVFQSIMKNLPVFSEVLELRTTTNNTEREREREREREKERPCSKEIYNQQVNPCRS